MKALVIHPRHRRPIRALSLVLCLLAAVLGSAFSAHANVAGTVLYAPSSANESMAYVRMIRLEHSGAENGTQLATFEHSGVNGTASQYIVRRSTDGGNTWSTLSTVQDGETGPGHPWSTLYQPFLFEFPQTVGAYPAGTLVMVANVLPANSSTTHFEEWRSTDHGATWRYIETFQIGGGGGAGIWEPFLQLNSAGQLVCYFSDERQNTVYSQKLTHIVSPDGGDTWSAHPDGSTAFAPGEVNDVASTTQSDRPGMATIARLPNGSQVMGFELCGTGHNCEAHVKTSTDGGNTWGAGPADLGPEVVTPDGRYLGSSPYVTWSPAGGPNGELLLTGMRTRYVSNNAFTPEDGQAVFVNTNNGTGAWSWMPAPISVSNPGAGTSNCFPNYSPDLLVGDSGTTLRYSAADPTGPYGCQEVTGSANAGVLPDTPGFSNGDPGWVRYGGSFSTANNVYSETAGGTGGNKAITGSTGWTNYNVAGDVRLGTGGNAGFLVRASNPAVGTDSVNAYFVGVSTGDIFVGKESYGWTPLTSTPIPGGLAPGSWYHLSVTVSGCAITIQGKPSGSTATPTPLTVNDCSFASGAVGVRDFGTTASWRNMAITPAA